MNPTPPTDYLDGLLEQVHAQCGPPGWELLRRAAIEHPQDPRPLVVLAAELMAAEKADPAEGAYVAALQRAPGLAIARFQLGLLQLTTGRPATAMATWGPLEALGPHDPLCLFKRGLEALALDDFQSAHQLLLAGIAANRFNEPLNKDMQTLIDRMIRDGVLPSAAPGQAAAPGEAPAPDPAPGHDPGHEHFLVSAYGREGAR